MNWKTFLCIAGFGTLASVATQATSAEVSATATFTGFSYTLIDLDPDDGVSPSFTMTPPFYSVSVANYLDNSGIPHLVEQLLKPGTAVIDDTSGKAQSSYDGTTASSSVTIHDGSPHFRSNIFLQWQFTLSPHTSLTLSGYGAVHSGQVGDVQTGAYTQLYAMHSISSSDPFFYPYFSDDLNTNDGDQSRHMNITFASDTTEINGSLGFTTDAGGWGWPPVATPVPEPSTYVMLFCGLITLTCAVRRKA